MLSNERGKIIITLEEYRIARGISKNQLASGANIQRTQLLKYLRNDVSRVDLNVLARICTYLQCDLKDIMQYKREN